MKGVDMKPLVIACTIIFLASCSKPDMNQTTADSLKVKIARFAPVTLSTDLSRLTPGDRTAIAKLVEAARYMDSIYLRQVWSGNVATLETLRGDKSEVGAFRLRLFELNMGPWSELDHQEPFVDGMPDRPEGANHYPEDITKDEFERWTATLPKAKQDEARGYFSVVRRNEDGTLRPVPFNEEYREWLEPASRLLREAASATNNASLKSFLEKRAAAFLSNDYYDSDVAWMDIDAPVEPTIGPYEVYMDELFNYKAAFEAYITVRNDEETNKLTKFGGYLQDIENNLPIDPKYRNPKLGGSAPIRVVDEVFVGGEARAGVQTAAFNLPNDERVIMKKGSKRVMLYNVQEAKFNNVLVPIAKTALASDQQSHLSFEQFFTHILAHELMHGLGPHEITVSGRKTTARQEMKELSSALEEAKADIAGLFALQHLIDKGILDKNSEQSLYTTFLAGVFRSVRFGINEAHGKGMALQFNYLIDQGAFTYNNASGVFGVDMAKIKPAVRKLTGDIMTLQAEGNYTGAKAMLEQYGVIRPELQAVLARLTDIPVDIAPSFVDVGKGQ